MRGIEGVEWKENGIEERRQKGEKMERLRQVEQRESRGWNRVRGERHKRS